MPRLTHAAILLANATALLLLGLSYWHQEQTRASVHHSAEVMDEMQQLRSAAIAARSQYDTYLKDATQLGAYRQALQNLAAEIDDAKRQTVDNAGQQARLTNFQALVRFQPQSPRKLLFTNTERLQLLAITGEEVGLLLQRQSQAERQANLVYSLLLSCFVVSIAATVQALSSARRLALKQLELADRTVQLETVLSHIPAVVLIRDRSGICLEILSEGDGLLFDPDRMLGSTPFEVAPIKVATQLMEAIEQSLNTQRTVEAEYEVKVSCERVVWFDATISPLPGDRVLIMASDATEEQKMYQQLVRLAAQDGLTQLYNFSTFVDLVQAEIALHERRHNLTTFAFCLCDLDHFKAINTTYSHEGGNLALQAVAKALQQNVRADAYVARLGGDELAVLLQKTDAAGAISVAERLKAAIADLRIPSAKGEIRVTVSVGIALYSESCNTFEALHQKASETLLRCKNAGRDRVCVAG